MENNQPIPAPRPRRAVPLPPGSDTTDASSSYENVTLKTVVNNFHDLSVEENKKPTPIPAPRRAKVISTNYENAGPNLYPNLKGMQAMQLELEAGLAGRSTGAIKKTNIPQSPNISSVSAPKTQNVPTTPNVPMKLNNDFSEITTKSPSSPKASGKYDFGSADVSSNSSMTRSKSQTSLNSSNSSKSNSEGKFKTQSPRLV